MGDHENHWQLQGFPQWTLIMKTLHTDSYKVPAVACPYPRGLEALIVAIYSTPLERPNGYTEMRPTRKAVSEIQNYIIRRKSIELTTCIHLGLYLHTFHITQSAVLTASRVRQVVASAAIFVLTKETNFMA